MDTDFAFEGFIALLHIPRASGEFRLRVDTAQPQQNRLMADSVTSKHYKVSTPKISRVRFAKVAFLPGAQRRAVETQLFPTNFSRGAYGA